MIRVEDEALYICLPDGITCFRAVSAHAAAECERSGFCRVVWRATKVRAEGGDESYTVRLPYRPDGLRLRCVD